MPFYTGSNTLRTRRSKKDGRKRTYSTVSSSTQGAQAGPVKSAIAEKNSSTTEQTDEPRKGPESQAAGPLLDKSTASVKEVPNVFEFLEKSEDSSDSSDSASDSSEDEPIPPAQAQASTQIQSPKPRISPTAHSLLMPRNSTSLKSDVAPRPGVISRSTSDSRSVPNPSAAASSDNQVQVAQKSVSVSKPPTTGAYSKSTTGTPPSLGQCRLQVSRPESYYISSADAAPLHRPPLPPSPPTSPEDVIHHEVARRRDTRTSQVTSGYGLVASRLTHSTKEENAGFPPLYRRFENVNHRVLLYLQDEISQMEEDLQTLDEYEEMQRVATAEQENTKAIPASRRLEAQSQAYSSLHYRRMDLMAALIQKTEQYNTALSAYSKVLQTLPSASEEDARNYRSWMKEHSPIAAAETRFLDNDADLVSLTPRLAKSAAAAPVYTAIIIASGAILLPLLAFSMISEFSGRLVVVTVTGGAAAAIAANYSAGIDTLVDSRDGWRCATLYFGFMTVSAMFIP